MSIICCEECSRFIDSDGDPECFVLVEKKDRVICANCRDIYFEVITDDYPMELKPK